MRRSGRRRASVSSASFISGSSATRTRTSFPSGGMRQRGAIARALAADPSVLLMDEPFAALDAQTREILHGELERIWGATRKTVVFVTHNVREAVRLADRVVLLGTRPGRVIEERTIDLPRPRSASDEEVNRSAAKSAVGSRSRSRRSRARRPTMRGTIRTTAFGVPVIALWALVTSHSTPLLPGPGAVMRALAASISDGTLPVALAKTLARLGVGYTIALLAGVPLGVALARVRLAKETVGPIVLGMSAVLHRSALASARDPQGSASPSSRFRSSSSEGPCSLSRSRRRAPSRRWRPRSTGPPARWGRRARAFFLTVTTPRRAPGNLGRAKLCWTFALRSLMAGELLFVAGRARADARRRGGTWEIPRWWLRSSS